MRRSLTLIQYLLPTLLVLLSWQRGASQSDSFQQKSLTDSTEIIYDSAKNKLFHHLKRSGDSERRKKIIEFTEDTIATRQDETIELAKKLLLDAQNYLENGLDTTGLNTELTKIRKWHDITSDGVFTNTGSIQTHRNLETSYKIMRELLTRMLARKSSVDGYYKKLVYFRNTIDSLYKEDILYKFSSDSVVLMRYADRLTVVLQEIKPIDSSLKKTIISISDLQPVVNRLVNKLNSNISQIAAFQKELSGRAFHREIGYLWNRAKYVRSFNEIISFSMIKGWLSFIFYINNEPGKIVLLLLLIIACAVFTAKLKRNLRKQNLHEENQMERSVLKYPILSSLVIILNCFQFIFIDPPFAFTALIWIISGLSLTIILKNFISKYWMNAWLVIFFLFFLACFDGLILQASKPERWLMLALSTAGIVSSSIIVIMGYQKGLKEKFFLYFLAFVVILQIASMLTNTFGRYNLSKTFLTAGFFNVTIAVLFFWTLRFVSQILALTGRLYNKPGKKLFSINFERVRNKTPRVFYLLFFVGWFVLFARNFYSYKLISLPIKNFIIQKRTIGEFSFTIGNVFEFFLILYISGLISKIVSFFASYKQEEPVDSNRKGGIGSWLLIIRISIISIGILIAFAAVGIPMDRLTIILSALSVGVGFGLQNLVNNLVSGLIISFEKPVSVGDIIEVGGQSGKIKSIGFRSSIIATSAGADVIIPNGYLLNQNLINWTRETNSGFVDIPFGVGYGTNLEQVIKILQELPAKDERILSDPKPGVSIKQFNSSSIDMQLTFWVKNIADAGRVKSDILLAINHTFKENSIQIPFPLQELRITRDQIDNERGEGE